MSLLKLISNVDSTTKTKLLGDLTTKLLRYTFVKSDTDPLPAKILDSAVASSLGEQLVQSKPKRRLLLDCLTEEIYHSLGHKDFNSGVKYYESNLVEFVSDFLIEKKYCEKSPKDNRSNYEIANPVYGECNGTNAFLHDYQYRLKRQIIKSLVFEFKPNLLVTMPTGAGKTVLGMESIVDYFRIQESNAPTINICWIVDSKELCEQSLQSFQTIWKQKGDHPIVVQRYFSRFSKIEQFELSSITFASFDLMVSRLKSEKVVKFLKNLDLLIIDEAHSSNASTYKEVINAYETYSDKESLLGLTATPYRNDDDQLVNLKSLFKTYLKIEDQENNEITSPIEYLKKDHYLANVNFETLSHNDRLEDIFLFYNSLHDSIIKECKKLGDNNQNVIIFAESKSHAICLSIFLSENQISNGLIVGETSDPLRKSYLKKFGDKNDSLNVLVNHQILSTGIDVPGMNAIMILSKIDSPTLALQILGRAMRGPKNGGNKENKVFLTKDNQVKLRQYNLLENQVLN